MQQQAIHLGLEAAASHLRMQGVTITGAQLAASLSIGLGVQKETLMHEALNASLPEKALTPEPLSDIAALIVTDVRRQAWDQAFGICTKAQAETLVEETAVRLTPLAGDREKAEALAVLWVD